uniref:Gag-pol polyprotein n=1 Tax=Solanum tuberosum TaxID=4113 RepID=M1BHW8_SOLTU
MREFLPKGPQGNKVPVDPPAMSNEEVRLALLMMALAITTQAKAMTAQATRGVETHVNPNVDPPAMSNEEVRSALLMMAQAVTTQAQAMTAKTTMFVETYLNPNVSTMASRLMDFVRMNPSVFLSSKVGEDPQDFVDQVYKCLAGAGTDGCYGCRKNDDQVNNFSTLTANGRETNQASLCVPDPYATKNSHFHSLRAREDKGALPDEGMSMLIVPYGCECVIKVPMLFSC